MAILTFSGISSQSSLQQCDISDTQFFVDSAFKQATICGNPLVQKIGSLVLTVLKRMEMITSLLDGRISIHLPPSLALGMTLPLSLLAMHSCLRTILLSRTHITGFFGSSLGTSPGINQMDSGMTDSQGILIS